MMRTMHLKICALALAVWYLVSIIGFGVHTCMASQRSFVTTIISGMNCEDIHPEHDSESSHHCCGHAEEGVSLEPASCCSEDFMVLEADATVPSNENDGYSGFSGSCGFHIGVPLQADHKISSRYEYKGLVPLPDSGLITPADVQSVLGIWRI